MWSRRYGGSGDDRAAAVAVDSSGAAVLAGFFQNTVDFGAGPVPSAGLSDIFVAKLSSAGDYVWSHAFGGTGSEAASGVAVDAAGRVAVTGAFQGSVPFGGTVLTSAGLSDVFLLLLGP